MMKPELIQAALQFLARVDLKGAEAPALMSVVASLQAMLQASEDEKK